MKIAMAAATPIPPVSNQCPMASLERKAIWTA